MDPKQFPASSGPRPQVKVNDPQRPLPETKRAEEVRTERRRRKDTDPNTAGMKLAIPESAKDPNYEYRWFIDEPGRVFQKTVNDDWDLIEAKDLKGHADPSLQAENGTRVARFAEKNATGSGAQPRKMFLARKRKELHEQDRRARSEALRAKEDAMKRSPAPVAGGVQGSTAYIPDRHDGFSGPEQGVNSIERG